MTSFSLDFPDDDILDILGDDVTIIRPSGGSTTIKGEFEYRYMEDELGTSIGIHYPVVEINNSDAPLFQKKYIVIFDGKRYSVLNKRPTDMGKTLVILRSK